LPSPLSTAISKVGKAVVQIGVIEKLLNYLGIPLKPPVDYEGSRHPVPMQSARVFRLIPPPLVGA